MKKIAICQSNYIPWKGYFDLINSADEFYLLDSVQYTKNDWRNRNMIKTANGLEWITIPVLHTSLSQKISETYAVDNTWRSKHFKSIKQNYSKSKYLCKYEELLKELYLGSSEKYLSIINHSFINAVCSILEIKTKICLVTEDNTQDKNQRLIDMCKYAKAQIYLSGPAAKQYIDEELFEQEGIIVQYMNYSSYPEYRQLYGKFEHNVSILDLIFAEGKNACRFMKSFSKKPHEFESIPLAAAKEKNRHSP